MVWRALSERKKPNLLDIMINNVAKTLLIKLTRQCRTFVVIFTVI